MKKNSLKKQKGNCDGIAVLIIIITLIAVGIMLAPIGICVKNKAEDVFFNFNKSNTSLQQKPYTEVVVKEEGK
jgi:hypothetical protein